MRLGEYGLPLYSGAFSALAAPPGPGTFVLHSSLRMIQHTRTSEVAHKAAFE